MSIKSSLRLRTAVPVAVWIGLALAILKLDPPKPYVIIWAVAAVAALAVTALSRTARTKTPSLIAFGVALALASAEVVASLSAGQTKTEEAVTGGTYRSDTFMKRDKDLGYVPRPSSSATFSKSWHDSVLFNVTYNIDNNGLRKTPGNQLGDTWLFAGCSFMFGEGVNDDQTLPSYFSSALGFRANILNIGVQGYGAHETLRALETGRLDRLVTSPVKRVVYEAILDHVPRTAGRKSWDPFGPRYVQNGDSVAYIGPFSTELQNRVSHNLRRSDLARTLLERRAETIAGHDLDLYVGVVRRIDKVSRSRYGARLTVLFWDDDTQDVDTLIARLSQGGVDVIRVSQIIPRSLWSSVTFPYDGHPTPEANRIIAAAIASRFATGRLAD